MSGRVNTRFIAIVGAVLAVLFAGAATVGYMVLVSTPEEHIADGDSLMDEGKVKEAINVYGKAVNKDPANLDYLDTYIDAIRSYVPPDKAELDDKFRKLYAAMRQQAVSGRTDADRWEAWLAFASAVSGPSAIVTQVGDAVRNFQLSGGDDSWKRILRYRGEARLHQLQAGRTLDQFELEQAQNDLREAIAADPELTRAAASLHRLLAAAAVRAEQRGNPDKARQLAAEAREVLDRAASNAPDDPVVQLAVLESRRNAPLLHLLGEEVAEPGTGELERVAEGFSRLPPERIEVEDLRRLRQAEIWATRSTSTPRTRALVDQLLDRAPDDAQLLLMRGEIAMFGNELQAAWDDFQRVVDLPQRAISSAARLLDPRKTIAIALQSAAAMKMWERAADQPGRDEALERLRSRHALLAERVPADSPQLVLSRARIAFAEGEMAEAARLMARYRSADGEEDASALWLRAQLAARAGNWSEARELLEKLRDTGRLEVSGGLLLADALVRTGELEEAVELYEQLNKTVPDSEQLRERLNSLRAEAGMGSSGDPVSDALAAARRIAEGTSLRPGDPAQALELLRRAEQENGPDPRLALQIADFQMRAGDIDAARATVDRAIQRFPDFEPLQTSRRALEGDTPLEIRFALLDETVDDEATRLLLKHAAAREYGEEELAARLLEDAIDLAPDDDRVIAAQFDRATARGDVDEAERLAERAAELDVGGARGLQFKARVQSMRGDNEAALASLERAVQLRPDSVSILRLLARAQRAAGHTSDALATYQDALSKRGNDPSLVYEYVEVLRQLGRNGEALTMLRENERLVARSGALREARLELEALVGDRARAMQTRSEIYQREPDNTENTLRLAELLIADGRWDDARTLIDRLRQREDSLALVTLAARWHADRGDLEAARQEFTSHIGTLFGEQRQDEVGRAYMALGEFLIGRGEASSGLEALRQAVRFEDPQSMPATRRLADRLAQMGRPAQAAEAYLRLVESDADVDREAYRRRAASSLLDADRLEEAEQTLSELEDPNAETALLLRAQLAQRQGDMQAARRLYGEAIERAPRSARPYMARAAFAMQAAEESGSRRLYADAREDLNTAIELDPGSAQAYRLRWRANMALGEHERALSDLRDSVRVGSPSPDAVASVMVRLSTTGREADADAVARSALERNPSSVRMRLAVASAYLQAGQVSRARQEARDLWQRTGTPQVADLYARALMAGEPRPGRAHEVLSAVRAHTEDDPQMLQLHARVLAATGRTELARRDLLRAWRLQVDRPRQLVAWNAALRQALDSPADRLAVIADAARGGQHQPLLDLFRAQELLAEQRTRGEALGLLDGVINSSADSFVRQAAVNLKGAALLDDQRPAEAAEVWRSALNAFPSNWQLYNNAAYVLADRLDRSEEALELARRAVELAPDRPEAHDTLGWVLFKAGEFEEAERELERSMQGLLGPIERPGTTLRLAKVKAAQRQAQAARELLQQVEAAWPAGEGLEASDRALLESVKTDLDSLG